MPIPPALAIGIALFLLIAIGGAISFKFLAIVFGLAALGLAIILQAQGKDPKHAILIAGISLMIAFMFSVGWTTLAGLALLAFAMFRFTAFKNHAQWIALVIAGIVLVLIGQYAAQMFGVMP